MVYIMEEIFIIQNKSALITSHGLPERSYSEAVTAEIQDI